MHVANFRCRLSSSVKGDKNMENHCNATEQYFRRRPPSAHHRTESIGCRTLRRIKAENTPTLCDLPPFFCYLIGTTSTTAVISRHILTALPSIAELLDSKRNIRVQPSHTNTNRYGDRMLHLPPPTLIGHRLLHINTIGHFDFDLHRPVMERLKPKFVN